MSSLSNWLRYVSSKVQYSVSLYQRTHGRVDSRSFNAIMKTLLTGRLTFLHRDEDVVPPTGAQGCGTFLVRGIPYPDPTNTFVGDLVMLKDPDNRKKYIYRRIAAIEGHEMVSTDEKDEPFVLGKNECWVLGGFNNPKGKSPTDSRVFGPVSMKNIVGRAIYTLVNDAVHMPVNNSHASMSNDRPILEMELDIDEMKKMQGQ